MANNYQMVTVHEYIKMLDNEVTYLDKDAKEIKEIHTKAVVEDYR